MKSIWLIQALTNIHVGDENTSNAGLIDKTVQRDVLTTIPCINASSLKGAMREYAAHELKMSQAELIAIFGADKGGSTSETAKGRCVFFDAQLLLLPIQDDNNIYKSVSSKDQIKQFVSLAQSMGMEYEYNDCLKMLNEINKHYELLDHKCFKALCEDDELPIIARNCLQGKGNLWYEQVLPQKTVFGVLLVSDDQAEVVVHNKETGKDETISVDLKDALSKFNGKIIQIGANATIGYGYCRFTKIKEG